MRRRAFIGTAACTALSLLTGNRGTARPVRNEVLFLEAEGFDDIGGWAVDQQSMDQIGSAFCSRTGSAGLWPMPSRG
jgi:hypothetical protein